MQAAAITLNYLVRIKWIYSYHLLGIESENILIINHRMLFTTISKLSFYNKKFYLLVKYELYNKKVCAYLFKVSDGAYTLEVDQKW